MKILHTTDLHFYKSWFEWITKQQKKFDVFIVSGDFLDSSKEENLDEQIEWISHWIKNFNKPLFTCSGNHDIEDFNNEDWLQKIDTSNYYCDGAIKTIEGVRFGVIGYLEDDFLEFSDCDVLITHLPPAKTKTAINKDGEDWGDKKLYRLIKNKLISPQIVCCGHMHRPIATKDTIRNTTIYNPGVNKKNLKVPNHHAIVFEETQ